MKKMKKNLLFLAAVVLNFGLLSCSSTDEDNLGETKTVVNMSSEAKPIELTEAQRVFVNDNNAFTLNFLKTVNETGSDGKSFIYSPLSITYVLGMVNDAAIGQTEQELEQILGFHEGGIQAVNDFCKNLIDNLPNVDQKVKLNIANAIFLNKLFTLKEQFQNDMQTYYDAEAEALDFSSNKTLDRINGWCADKTNGMITKILEQVDPIAVSYLLNAIYFKADWASKFDTKNTHSETFATENGQTQLPLMHQNVLISYMKNDTYAAVDIPYGNGSWSMTVMLPEEGKTTDDIIARLSRYGLEGYGFCGTMGDTFLPYEVDLKLPRFETSSDTNELPSRKGLIGVLQTMGIQLAFDAYKAEIPNLCENSNVYISMMRQKAKIKVDEEGSEAAAVTVADIVMSAETNPPTYPKTTFHANRPFVYVIREASSGVILFVGKFTGE